VTLIANYLPLQDAYGGPNYFAMDPNALYEIHVDNNGDAREDLTFQFRFTNSWPTAVPASPCRWAARTWPSRWCRPVPVANVRDASLNLAETLHRDRGAR
jgi:hypothetical protein